MINLKLFNILNKYIFIEYMKFIFQITLLFFFLSIVLNLFEEINFFKDLKVSILFPLYMSFLKTPAMLEKIFPFIFLISSMVLFVKLTQSNEIVLLKLGGISNFRIILYPAIISFLLGLIIVSGYKSFSSNLLQNYLQIKNNYSEKKENLAVLTENGIWIKDKINNKINFITAGKLTDHYLIGVTIFVLNDDFKLEKRIRSEKIDISSTKWKLYNSVIHINFTKIPQKNTFINFETNFDITSINSLFTSLEAISFWKLKSIKRKFNKIGYSTREIDGKFHKAISFPFYLMLMSLLAGIVVFSIKFKGGYSVYIFVSIFISVIAYYFNDFSKALGDTQRISLILSIWMPIILYSLTTLIGIFYIYEK